MADSNKGRQSQKERQAPRNTQDNKPKDNSVTVAVIGAIATITAAIIGLLALWVKPPSTTNPTAIPTLNSIPLINSSTPTETLLPSYEIFTETFDNNNSNWWTGKSEDDNVTVENYLENGKYYFSIESKDIVSETYRSISMPTVYEKNFCLMLDARFVDDLENASIILNLRENDFGTGQGSYYILHLYANGGGTISFDMPGSKGTKKLKIIEKGLHWNDKLEHTVKISFQESELTISDDQNGSLEKFSFEGENLLLDKGKIRLGVEAFNPHQKVTVEFDNIYIYNYCP